MNAHNHPLATAADLIVMLASSGLSLHRRRDMISAVNRICEMVGCSPMSLDLDVAGLRSKLADIQPAAHRISRKTWANIRSLFGAALEAMGVVDPLGRGVAGRDPHWSVLVAAIADNKRLSSGLAALLNWCAERGIKPAEVDDALLQRFYHWLERRTLHANPRGLVWNIPKIWNDARRLVPGWPATDLAPVSFKARSQNLRWDELSDSFRADAEAYLDMRRQPDLFATDPSHPKRPLAPTTVRQQREHIRLAASVLVRRGSSAESLATVGDLVKLEPFKDVLRHYHQQAAGRPNAFAVGVAKTLIDVARYQVKLPEAALRELKAMAAKLPAVPNELTEKNKALLGQLEGDRTKARLMFLPDELRRKVEAAFKKGRIRFVEAQVAVAIDLLLVAPMRPENLSRLNWERHFREPDGQRGKLVLYIPKAETKSGKRDLTFEIPAEVAGNIRWYRKEILSRLGADSRGDLFVTQGGGRKQQATLALQVKQVIAEHVGIHMTPHQFRHFAANLYLEEHPEGFQNVSDLLGHASTKTTLIYAGSSSRRASRAYGRHVLEQREALRLMRPAKGRRPKKLNPVASR